MVGVLSGGTGVAALRLREFGGNFMNGKNWRRMLLHICFVAVIVVAMMGCGAGYHFSKSNSSQIANEIPDADPIELSDPTFSKTISKLVNRHCTSCHQAGGIAPFPLTTYEAIKGMSGPILNAVVNRTMPPPSVDNSGDCQKFSNSTWLKKEEIQAFQDWIQNGMPEGERSDALRPPSVKSLSEPKQQMRMPQAYTPQPPAGEIDDYRCFVLDPQQGEDTLITAIQVLPDKVPQVHHVIVFKPTSAEAQAAAEQKSGSDGRPGYSCFGAAGVPSTIVGLWAPGGKAEEMRDPVSGRLIGLTLEKNRKLIMQVHYNTQNGAVPDQSAIVMKTTKDAIRAKWMVMANFLLSLNPGLPSVEDSDTQGSSWWQTVGIIFERGLADEYIAGGGLLSVLSAELIKLVLNQPDARDFTVYGVAPHMHILGKRITLEKIGEQSQTMCMADVPKFDFHWQAGYNYVQPLTLGKNDKLKLTCQFNTTGRTEKIRFGEGTTDEMCLAFLLVAE